MYVRIGLLIPFIGTTLGSAMVFFMKNSLNKKTEKLLLGFASGVMIAASIWSLLIPSIDMSQDLGFSKWIPATIGFLLGVFFLIILDKLLPHFGVLTCENQISKTGIKKIALMILAVTIHNIPEGMAVRCYICRTFNEYSWNNNI